MTTPNDTRARSLAEAIAERLEIASKATPLDDVLGELLHVGYRHGTDAFQAHEIWKLIQQMPDSQWGAYVGYVSHHLQRAVIASDPATVTLMLQCIAAADRRRQAEVEKSMRLDYDGTLMDEVRATIAAEDAALDALAAHWIGGGDDK